MDALVAAIAVAVAAGAISGAASSTITIYVLKERIGHLRADVFKLEDRVNRIYRDFYPAALRRRMEDNDV